MREKSTSRPERHQLRECGVCVAYSRAVYSCVPACLCACVCGICAPPHMRARFGAWTHSGEREAHFCIPDLSFSLLLSSSLSVSLLLFFSRRWSAASFASSPTATATRTHTFSPGATRCPTPPGLSVPGVPPSTTPPRRRTRTHTWNETLSTTRS